MEKTVDIKEVLEIQEKTAQYFYKIKKLEAKKNRVIRQIDELQDRCQHNYVLYFGAENSPINADTYGVCACCRKRFFFSRSKDYEAKLKASQIISVLTYLEKNLGYELDFETLNLTNLINRANAKLISIAALDPNIPNDALKEEIKNDLLAYMINLEKEKGFSRIRN
ncbi:MAG: hypothetical protein IJN03_01710 [Bacilli bacterium]|nr:hypothetical protein [Bacilli bacterium]